MKCTILNFKCFMEFCIWEGKEIYLYTPESIMPVYTISSYGEYGCAVTDGNDFTERFENVNSAWVHYRNTWEQMPELELEVV